MDTSCAHTRESTDLIFFGMSSGLDMKRYSLYWPYLLTLILTKVLKAQLRIFFYLSSFNPKQWSIQIESWNYGCFIVTFFQFSWALPQIKEAARDSEKFIAKTHILFSWCITSWLRKSYCSKTSHCYVAFTIEICAWPVQFFGGYIIFRVCHLFLFLIA